MVTKVQKWGNSLGVRIPRAAAIEARMDEGAEVDVSVQRGRVVLSPVARHYDLKGLLAKVTERNRHAEVDSGKPIGREAW